MRQSVLESIRYKLGDFQVRRGFENPIKEELKAVDLDRFRRFSDLVGQALFLPEYSYEAVNAFEAVGGDGMVIVEANQDTWYWLHHHVYEIPAQVPPGWAHDVLAPDTDIGSLAYGHFDFYGSFNSQGKTGTRTDDVIAHLSLRASRRSCWAFTHASPHGHGVLWKFKEHYEGNLRRARKFFGPQVEDYIAALNLDNPTKESLRSFVTFLICVSFAHWTNRSALVLPDYEYAYRMENGKNKMIKSCVTLNRDEEFDPELLLGTLITMQKEEQTMPETQTVGSRKVTPAERVKIIAAIRAGRSDKQIRTWWPHLSTGSLAAFKANATRGTYNG